MAFRPSIGRGFSSNPPTSHGTSDTSACEQGPCRNQTKCDDRPASRVWRWRHLPERLLRLPYGGLWNRRHRGESSEIACWQQLLAMSVYLCCRSKITSLVGLSQLG